MAQITASNALLDAWRDYHLALEEVRQLTEESPRFQETPQHRAKAYHTLMEMQAMAYNLVIAPRRLHPRILVNCGWSTDLYTLGQNCQDFLYGALTLDGRQTYRMRGRRGDLTLFLLQVQDGMHGEPGVKTVGNYDLADLQVDADGKFEITLGPQPQPGNWIPLNPDIHFQFILLRRALPKWDGDRGELSIERISELPDDFYDEDEFDEHAMAIRIQRAAHFVRHMTREANLGLYDAYLKNAGGQKNTLTLLPGTMTSQISSPSSNYAMAIFELAEDEALLIEMDNYPDGAYWSFQLGDVWSRSLDYASHQSTLSDTEIVADSDGKIRIVVSHQDPHVSNWLDTCGRVEGAIIFRNYRATSAPVPSSRKIKIKQLRELLRGANLCSSAERKALLQRRLQAQRRLYGE